ncbi:MAG: hypothetical protein U1E23_18695 [Reyranellaceae bacterium]
MAKLVRETLVDVEVNDRDIAMAAYALLQSQISYFAEKRLLSAAEALTIYRRASEVLRRRSDAFERAASILDQEARFWEPPRD